jgi:hypothetical protein
MRSFCLSLLLIISYGTYAGSDSTHAKVVHVVPQSFLNLRITNDSISANDILNEQIVDMVNVDERDRKVPTPYTTHQGGVLGGWFIRMIGYYWQAVDRKRYKFVGTNKNGLSMPGDRDQLTEHDINFNLIPHLDRYMNFVYRGRTEQTKRHQFRRAKHADLTKPPYIPPTLSTAEIYDLHCELTPPKKMRDSVNAYFYPCQHGYNLDKHPNFCDMKPTVGMYGVFVLDCNHACHPEIHPYEWLWWLKLTEAEKTKGNFNKSWFLGFFRESSNRFILWSQRPRVGTISVPFIYRTSETKSYLKLSKVVDGRFRPHGIHLIKTLPAQTSTFDFTDTTINVHLNNGKDFPLHLRADRPIKTKALRWWLSDLHTDEANEWVWGYMNIVVSVANGYTAKLESVTVQ